MKKLIIAILTLSLIATVFASCTKTEIETTTYEPVIEFPTEETTGEEVTTEASTTEEATTETPAVEESTTEVPTTEVPTTQAPETTTKAPETTTKVPETTTKVPETTTKAPEPTTKAPETTKPQVDISYYDGNSYSPERAGLIYDECGLLSTYDKIPEGSKYIEFDENGHKINKEKPYSPGNEPEYDINTCRYCGKHRQGYDGKHYACYYGYCSRFYVDVECPECGTAVKANTCHSCKF